VVVHEFESDRVKPKTMKLVLVAFLLSTQALKKKSKDWSAHNQNNVSQWGDMSIYGLLFQ